MIYGRVFANTGRNFTPHVVPPLVIPDGNVPTEETEGSELPPEKSPPNSDDAKVTSDGVNKDGGQDGNAIVGDGNKLDEKTTTDSSTPLQRTSSDHNNNTPDALKKEILEVKETPPAPQEVLIWCSFFKH